MINEYPVKCPSCDWIPEKDSSWHCSCGHTWNTFDTGGKCPACHRQWRMTQCITCYSRNNHFEWYQPLKEEHQVDSQKCAAFFARQYYHCLTEQTDSDSNILTRLENAYSERLAITNNLRQETGLEQFDFEGAYFLCLNQQPINISIEEIDGFEAINERTREEAKAINSGESPVRVEHYLFAMGYPLRVIKTAENIQERLKLINFVLREMAREDIDAKKIEAILISIFQPPGTEWEFEEDINTTLPEDEEPEADAPEEPETDSLVTLVSQTAKKTFLQNLPIIDPNSMNIEEMQREIQAAFECRCQTLGALREVLGLGSLHQDALDEHFNRHGLKFDFFRQNFNWEDFRAHTQLILEYLEKVRQNNDIQISAYLIALNYGQMHEYIVKMPFCNIFLKQLTANKGDINCRDMELELLNFLKHTFNRE